MAEAGASSVPGFEISVERDYMLVRADPARILTADGIISALQKLFSTAAFRLEKAGTLWDFRGCKTDLRYQTIEKIGSFVISHHDQSWSNRFTALVGDTEVLYGLARMYDAVTHRVPTEVEVFREIEPAHKWLTARAAEAAAGPSGADGS